MTPRTILAASMLALLPGLTTPVFASEEKTAKAVLTCGGIGSDESSAMLAESKRQSLTLLYVSHDGHYMSDVQTRIETLKGEVLAEQACGPIGQINVPAKGRYRIKTSFADQKHERTLTLRPGAGQRQVLRWKAE